MAQAVAHLLSKRKALSSNSSTTKKNAERHRVQVGYGSCERCHVLYSAVHTLPLPGLRGCNPGEPPECSS
jgi:hypothetical protein